MTTIRTEGLQDHIHLIIHDDASPDGGGIQNMAYWIARHMEAKGLRMVVAGRLDSSVFMDSSVEVFALNKPFRTTHTSDIRLFLLLARLRFRYGRDVILYSLLINNIKVFRWLRVFLRWKCVSFLHGNETLRLLHRKPGTLRKNLRACMCVFANSRYTAGLVKKLGPLDNLSVVSPGIPLDRYGSYSSEPGAGQERYRNRKTVLMLSQLVKRVSDLRKEVDSLLTDAEQADSTEDGIYGKGKRGDRLPEELRFKTRNPHLNNVPGGFRVWSRYSVRSKRLDDFADSVSVVWTIVRTNGTWCV